MIHYILHSSSNKMLAVMLHMVQYWPEVTCILAMPITLSTYHSSTDLVTLWVCARHDEIPA